MLKGKQTSHGIFTWSLENENTHNRVQQQGDPRIMLSVCVCRERRGLQTSALFHGSEKQLLFSCNSLLLKRRERRPTHMKPYPSFSTRLAAQIVGVSPLRWRTVKAKISTSPSPSPVEFVRHSYDSSALPEILPSPNLSVPLALTFPFFFFFLFSSFPFTSLINKSIKNFKKTTL